MSEISYIDAIKLLSPRENEVLDLTLQGMTCKEIAIELYLSPATIKRHRENICAKLGLQGSHALLKWYVRQSIDGAFSP
ncbi:MAG: helix-turn-helix transcriptional regulator [Balneolales bacterium]|nr:helix-turn-helix transcriptional regulator [Balneolales bacterium]